MAGVVFVLTHCLAAGYAIADGQTDPELKMNDISGVLKESQEKAEGLQVPENDRTDDRVCQEAAEKLMEKFNSLDFQARMRDEQQRLQETVFKDILTESLSQDDQDPKPDAQPGLAQLYLFVSSSVPLTTLHNYAAMIDRARASRIIMVLRGFVGGMKKIRPTMEFIGEILKKDPACDLAKEEYPSRGHKCDSCQVNIQVDPLLFQRFAIEEVPALAYLQVNENDAEGKQAEPIIIYGDAGLDYLLERINKEAKSAELDTLIATLRGGIGKGE